MKKIEHGFTLIEILVVISIIGILIAISLFGVQGARVSSRDTKRKADVEQIASALEIFKNDCGYYPNALPAVGASFTGATCFNAVNANVYLAAVPADPVSGQIYGYIGIGCVAAPAPTHCTGYQIGSTLEGSNPASCAAPPPSCTVACNYCIKNP